MLRFKLQYFATGQGNEWKQIDKDGDSLGEPASQFRQDLLRENTR